MNFTPAQQNAITAHGDTLVIAGAGTGKTRTLVERCVQRLLDESSDIGLDEILVVTFTEAAAAEIRQRIRVRLEAELARQPNHGRLLGQLAALDTAHISTLHSFCLKLVRQHFHDLGIDPQVAVLADEQTALLAEETLEVLFEHHYRDPSPESEAVRTFLQDYARSWETRVRQLILELHHFTQTRPDPEGWFERQLARFATTEPSQWRTWFFEAIDPWRRSWWPILAQQPEENSNAHRCLAALEMAGDLSPIPEPGAAPTVLEGFYQRIRTTLEGVLASDTDWPAKCKTVFREPLKQLFEEAAFLISLCPRPEGAEPLAEDWGWIREQMTTLLRLAREFTRDFSAAKRERGVVDFHDLEQFALRLLWDPERRQPTLFAQEWQAGIKLVFVDEYQDINEAQDTILTALSRVGTAANRFLVGDVKQSIYRFRQAAPHIFQQYAQRWNGSPDQGQALFLQDNFRSREALLAFINPLFSTLMRREIGGVDYDQTAALQFGHPDERNALSIQTSPGPTVELHLRIKEKAAREEEEEESAGFRPADLNDAEREAHVLAKRLRQLHETRFPVWDLQKKTMRPVVWSDMVVLLRSPRSKVDSYAKEFARLGVPLQAKRSGFFDSIEVLDLVNLLSLLDNPLQDLPAVAVLRSPLAGLTLDELARIRLAASHTRFWTALLRWHQISTNCDMYRKVDGFLRRFFHWRAQARTASLAQRLEMILHETSYLDWVLTQPRGEQRQANVARLLTLAREFDTLHPQGLHRFLRMIEAQREATGDREPAPLESGDAVRLMSIHQSKGLEFPVVVLADLGKRFNLSETKSGLALDETFGLCPQVRPPGTGQYYPSLPLWLARRRQRAEALGEEMRILYVAMTRAQDRLILCGTCTTKALREKWSERAGPTPPSRQLLQAGSYLDWLGPWLVHTAGSPDWADRSEGQNPVWSWHIHLEDPSPETDAHPLTSAALPTAPPIPISDQLDALRHRLHWSYPFQSTTHAPAKSSVSALRQLISAEDDESQPARYLADNRFAARFHDREKVSASEVGLAHHRFLQCLDLARANSLPDLERETDRLVQARLLSPDEKSALDLPALAAFWQSEVGQQIRARAPAVRREWPFTCRLTARDLEALGPGAVETVPEGEFIVVQGVADLVVLLDDETWLLDFKTDHFREVEMGEKVQQYTPQLQLYRLALERIRQKPVTRAWFHFLALGRTVPL
jgi:ATP-dependent helicase/nuclease subunit A